MQSIQNMALYVVVTPRPYPSVYNSNYGTTDTYGDIVFNVYDDNNNQPASGNGLQVIYNELENGRFIIQKSRTILGTSDEVYTNVLLERMGGYQSYYFDISIESYVQPAGTIYQGNGPTITGVRILQTAHLSGNGVMLTVANSSDGSDLQYFIDDLGPFNPRFDGLTAGWHTAKVRDQNGREASLVFFMPDDEPFLVDTPNKELLPNSNINSRWHAAFNPLVFAYQRKDFRVTDVQSVNDNPCLYTREAVTGLNKGDLVYVNADPYQGIFTVKSATDTTVTLDVVFISNSAGATGFMNSDTLRPYYKLVSEISYTDPDTRAQKQSEYRHSPNPRNGRTEADYSGVLRSLVTTKSDSYYDQLNYNDTNLCASYSVRYREEWEGGPDDRWFQIPGYFYVTYSAMQVQSKWGSNMGKFVPFIQGSQALFVTDFKEPAYTPGYPFDIGFIYSELLYDIPYDLHITQLDVNRRTMSDPIVHRLAKQIGLNRLLLSTTGYFDNCWYLRLKIYGDNNGPVQVTEDKVIRIDRAIDVNSVYLRWIGYSGSWEYYRFVWNQEVSLNVQNAVTVKRYVYDYENTEGTEDTISKEAAAGIKVFAEDLSVADIRGLQSLKTSPKVQWLASRNPMRWQTVIVATGSAVEYETQLGTYAYQLQFTLPGVVVQTL
jgi:hypothetical protein